MSWTGAAGLLGAVLGVINSLVLLTKRGRDRADRVRLEVRQEVDSIRSPIEATEQALITNVGIQTLDSDLLAACDRMAGHGRRLRDGDLSRLIQRFTDGFPSAVEQINTWLNLSDAAEAGDDGARATAHRIAGPTSLAFAANARDFHAVSDELDRLDRGWSVTGGIRRLLRRLRREALRALHAEHDSAPPNV